MRTVRFYTDYTLTPEEHSSKKSLRKAKASILQELKNEKRNTEGRRTVTRHYFKVPLSTAHRAHPVGEAGTVGHSLHPKIASKIRELVRENITNADVVRKCLEQYVEKEMFGGPAAHQKPRRSNRRYYPSRQDLRSHIARAVSASKYCDDDQESLRRKVEQWSHDSPTSKFFLRTRDDDKDGNESKFMFVHQEEWQQRLLLRYGSDLVLMDATYKTTKYAIPLFFICVHTNVGYKVVAEFLCQNEDKECIAEALDIIKSWNPTWRPKYFMVDYSTAEINAIESVFQEVAVYICDFHREQAWQRWVKSGKNGLTTAEQKMFLEFMQAIARARSENGYRKAVENLRKSKLYVENPKVQDYCEKVWLDCSDRWAHAFRVQQVLNIVNTNNGIEAQNKVFKYTYLPRSLDKSVFGIVVMLVESFVPDSYQHYLDTNLQLSGSYRAFNRDIPDYLHNRPPHFVKHCLRSNFAAAEFSENDVNCVSLEKGEFLVRSSSDSSKLFPVNFSEPTCKCEAWRKTQFPCKHFYAVFKFFEKWDFNRLPHYYKNNVFITLDTGHFDESKEESPSEPCAMEELEDVPSEECNELEEAPLPFHDDKATAEFNTVSSRPKSDCQEHHSNTTKLRKRLQERIDALRSTTFLVSDSTVLENAIKTVENVLQEVQKSACHENGLPLRQSRAKKKLKITQVDYHKVIHKALPARRRRKKIKRERGVVVDLGKDDNTTKDNAVESKEVNKFVACVQQAPQQ